MILFSGVARPLPWEAGYVTQWFGENDVDYSTVHPALRGHNGIDYGVPIGVPVLAAHSGVAGFRPESELGIGVGFGNQIWVVCEDAFETLYGHLSEILISQGQQIEAGQLIGRSGSTGFSTGPHLHFGFKWHHGSNPGFLDWVDPYPLRLLHDLNYPRQEANRCKSYTLG